VARLAAEKPVIACFGDVAASGGYYVACGARAIVGSPLTVTGSIGVFAQRFSNFIALLPTGAVDAGSGLPIWAFEGVRANLRGVEAEARFHVVDTEDREFHVDLRGDYTRAENATSGAPLPRIAPLRTSVAATYREGGLTGRVEAIRASDQNRVTSNELATDGYTLVNARITYRVPQMLPVKLELFLRANNLLNEEIRIHTSTLKDIAPMAGRNFMVGVNGSF
jgi:iron complex outermembrane receptor protein